MELLVNFLIIIITIFGLWLGANWIVEASTRIARKLGVTDLIIGLTVVSFATSAPEFAVTISAAMKGQESISVGNVIGSNIFNLGIILGIVAIFRELKISSKLLKRDGMLLLVTGILLVIFFADSELSLIEGTILMTILFVYLILLIKNKEPIQEDIPKGKLKWFSIPKLILGSFILIVSADYLIDSATLVARTFNISDWIIAITIVAIGTSLPELATSMVAVYRGEHGISAGNLIGSDLFNMLGVLGLAAVIRPLSIEQNEFIGIIMFVAQVIIVLLLMSRGMRLTRVDGMILIFVTMLRWYLDFII